MQALTLTMPPGCRVRRHTVTAVRLLARIHRDKLPSRRDVGHRPVGGRFARPTPRSLSVTSTRGTRHCLVRPTGDRNNRCGNHGRACHGCACPFAASLLGDQRPSAVSVAGRRPGRQRPRHQEPLGSAGGAEAFHGAFALPGRLVRVLRPVVQVPRLPVLSFMTPSIAALLGRWFWWPQQVRQRPVPEPWPEPKAEPAAVGAASGRHAGDEPPTGPIR